jgi:predicted metallo-beta-lactamase superfamily hydrolase
MISVPRKMNPERGLQRSDKSAEKPTATPEGLGIAPKETEHGKQQAAMSQEIFQLATKKACTLSCYGYDHHWLFLLLLLICYATSKFSIAK